MRLLLFDIDGTLLRSNGAGRMAMTAMLMEMFGTTGPIESYRMDGKTDPMIITDLLTAAGVPKREIEDKLPQAYQLMAEKAVAIFPERALTPCQGVPALLEALRQRQDVMLGLLTGNVSLTAPLKLSSAGIDPAQFVVGAYGSDGADRNALPAIAIERANQLTDEQITGNNTVIIGDTPADILCARAGKATAIAVASGWHSATTLATHRPDHLFETLADTEAVLRSLLGTTS